MHSQPRQISRSAKSSMQSMVCSLKLSAFCYTPAENKLLGKTSSSIVTLISRLVFSSCICLKSGNLDLPGNSAISFRAAPQKRSHWAKAGLRQSSCSTNSITSTDSTFKTRRPMISNSLSCFKYLGRPNDFGQDRSLIERAPRTCLQR